MLLSPLPAISNVCRRSGAAEIMGPAKAAATSVSTDSDSAPAHAAAGDRAGIAVWTAPISGTWTSRALFNGSAANDAITSASAGLAPTLLAADAPSTNSCDAIASEIRGRQRAAVLPMLLIGVSATCGQTPASTGSGWGIARKE